MAFVATTRAHLLGTGIPASFLDNLMARAVARGSGYASTYGVGNVQTRVLANPDGSFRAEFRGLVTPEDQIAVRTAATAPAPTQTTQLKATTREAPVSLTSTTSNGYPAPQFGIFGDILGGIAKVGGGLITGGIPGAIGAGVGLFGGGGQQAPPPPPPSTPVVPFRFPQQAPPPPPRAPSLPGIGINPPFAGPPGVGVTAGMFQQAAPPRPPQQFNGTGPAPSGYHWNKTSYHLRDGTYVPAGTKLVKNRRRNAMNPRALSRALARVDSAKRWQSKLQGITTRRYTSSGARRKC